MIKKQILDAIKKHERFLISTHINPDGDAIGCQLAMAKMLKAMGKSVRIINNDPVPKNYMFLPDSKDIECYCDVRGSDVQFDAVIIVDCPGLERIGKVRELLKNGYVISIDHHISNAPFGDINWADAEASSVGEMIYDLYKSSDVVLGDLVALFLYVSIMTDTGSFRYSNTTNRTHEIIAELLKFNVKPKEIYAYIYENKSFAEIKLLGEALNTLQRSEDGKIAWIKVSRDMFKRNGLTSESTEDFIDRVRMIDGVEVAIFLRELEDVAGVKISFRSKSDVNVNEIAGAFGGGGHAAASGCVIDKPMAESESLILEQVQKAINNK
ncbi:MAG: bifunctional oligoribonuclease/PAP phosphatase NrnA [PVC group bacterium]|nr:bifunctional oligoribonuclease/PAP phosphatase NrnA [PVC group bacterium]